MNYIQKTFINMANHKKYKHKVALYQVQCKDADYSTFLRNNSVYDVIGRKGDKLLIRFHSGGAKWYSATRFN